MKTHPSAPPRRPPTKRSARWGSTPIGVLLGAAAVTLTVLTMTAGAPLAADTQSPPEQAAKGKSYKATRAFVVDKDTGKARMPTQQEVDEVIANLSALGQRPAETLAEASQPNGTVSVNLDGGFGGIILARPNDDGTWETKCVSTVEEGAEFLGLLQDDASK
jgi:hypothetical protein